MDIQVLGITDRLAVVSWSTDERADSLVDFGTTTQYDMKASDSGHILKHSLLLTSLRPSTTYHYRVSSKDPAGNTASSGYATFNTTATPDKVPPVISNVTVTGMTDRLALVTWQTDEPADTSVDFGKTGSYGKTASARGFSVLHQLTLTNLDPTSTYHFRVSSKDPSGNGPSFSGDLTFTTGNTPDARPPTITNARAERVTATSAVILWETDEPADGFLEYGPNSSRGASLASDIFSTDHQFILQGLMPGTTYHFRVRSTDPTGNPSQPFTDLTFTTASNQKPQTTSTRPSGGFPWWLVALAAIVIVGCVAGAAMYLRRPKKPAIQETPLDIETVDIDEPETVQMDNPPSDAKPQPLKYLQCPACKGRIPIFRAGPQEVVCPGCGKRGPYTPKT
jgi:chitodextrinase